MRHTIPQKVFLSRRFLIWFKYRYSSLFISQFCETPRAELDRSYAGINCRYRPRCRYHYHYEE